MKSVTQLRSLGDIRTTISTHSRSTPRQRGSTYLQVYLLDMERQRLQTELTMLTKRQRRINLRLAEIHEEMTNLKQDAEASLEPPPGSPAGEAGPSQRNASRGGKWREMTVGY